MQHTVTLYLDENKIYKSIEIEDGNTIPFPSNPHSISKSFTGWYTDTEATIPFDFDNTAVYDDITLYAGWKSNTKKLFIITIILALIFFITAFILNQKNSNNTQSDETSPEYTNEEVDTIEMFDAVTDEDPEGYQGLDIPSDFVESGIRVKYGDEGNDYPGKTDMIQIPGFAAKIPMSKDQFLKLYNPKENKKYYLHYVIKDESGNQLYSSGLVEPGKAVYWQPDLEPNTEEKISIYAQGFSKEYDNKYHSWNAASQNITLIITE